MKRNRIERETRKGREIYMFGERESESERERERERDRDKQTD